MATYLSCKAVADEESILDLDGAYHIFRELASHLVHLDHLLLHLLPLKLLLLHILRLLLFQLSSGHLCWSLLILFLHL